MMLTPPLPAAETGRLARQWYEKLRPIVETPENIGKQIVINVQTGDYEIDDSGLAASHRLFDKDPYAPLFAFRIGYNAVYSLGGVLTRTMPL